MVINVNNYGVDWRYPSHDFVSEPEPAAAEPAAAAAAEPAAAVTAEPAAAVDPASAAVTAEPAAVTAVTAAEVMVAAATVAVGAAQAATGANSDDDATSADEETASRIPYTPLVKYFTNEEAIEVLDNYRKFFENVVQTPEQQYEQWFNLEFERLRAEDPSKTPMNIMESLSSKKDEKMGEFSTAVNHTEVKRAHDSIHVALSHANQVLKVTMKRINNKKKKETVGAASGPA